MRSQSGEYNCTLEHSIGSGPASRYIVTRHASVTIDVQCEEYSMHIMLLHAALPVELYFITCMYAMDILFKNSVPCLLIA